MPPKAIILEEQAYNGLMRTGRPTSQERTPFGQRLFEARITAGVSQTQVAEKMGVSQSGYAAWERGRSSPSPEQIEELASMFGVPVASFFGKTKRTRSGPKGKALVLFEEVSALPRHQQQTILQTVETLLAGQKVLKKEEAQAS